MAAVGRCKLAWCSGNEFAFLASFPYFQTVIATNTSKGQITLPLALRQRLNLKPGDQLEFDENSPVLIARRVVHRGEWERTLGAWKAAATDSLKGHPWENETSSNLIDDLRGGPVEPDSGQP